MALTVKVDCRLHYDARKTGGTLMAHAYEPDLWHEFFLMLGTSATALVGLLFVVLTIHLQAVQRDRDFHLRARNNAYHLLNVFAVSALALAPQSAVFLGVEVALICLYALRLPVGVTWHFYHQDKAFRQGKRFWIGIIITIIITYALGVAGGAALITGSSWGLPLVGTCCVLLVVRTVLTAWALMFGVGPADRASKPE